MREASFVARTIDSDRSHLTQVLRAAAEHRGTSLVEIYQNCPIFNDNAFDAIKDADTKADAIIPLQHGEKIIFGGGRLGVVRDPVSGTFSVAEVDQVGTESVVTHDAHLDDPGFAFGLSRLTDAGALHQSPIGIFRSVERGTYDDATRDQLALAAERSGHPSHGDDAALQQLLAGGRHLDRGVTAPSGSAPASLLPPGPDADAQRFRTGVGFGIAAYAGWGLVPLFWPLAQPASALEILAHRVVWSLVTALALIAIGSRRGWLGTGWLDSIRSRRVLGLLSLAAVLVAINWGVFIWAVNHDHVVETALGYYINPILSILAGVLLLHERLAPVQWAAVGLAVVAVVVLTVGYGQPPWIAMTLATSFASYGLIKNRLKLGGIVSLAVESAVLTLPALAMIIWLGVHGQSSFGSRPVTTTALLLAGPVTVVPLLLFAGAVTRIPLSLVGLLQYLAPTMSFLLGIFWFGEAMPPARWAGFALVWVALILLTGDALRRLRRSRRTPAPVEPVL